MTKKNIVHAVWAGVLCLLVLLRFWLVSCHALNGSGEAPHDAGLFFRMAVNLINGNWLGNYDSLILAKGPVYSIWMALVYRLDLPLLLAQQVLYTAACMIFALALKPLIKNRFFLGLLFLALLFNPMSYSGGIGAAARIIRGGIYISLTLLVLAGAIGLLARAQQPNRGKIFWILLLGFSFPLFWMTREEGIWLLPSVVLLVGAAAFLYWFSGARRLISYWPFVLPLILTVSLIGAVSAVNYRYYGYWGVVDMKAPGFQAAYGALGRVKHENWKPDIPVPVDVRKKLYRFSSKFAQFEDIMEGGFFSGLRRTSRDRSDFGGGWFMWALRTAAQNAGYFRSAEEAEDFFQQMADEINRACDMEKLSCYGERSSLMPPLHAAYLQPFFSAAVEVYRYLVGFDGFTARNSSSTGPMEALLAYRNYTHNQLEPFKEIKDHTNWKYITGWAFHEQYSLKFTIIDDNNKVVQTIGRRLHSHQLYSEYAGKGKVIENARKANFEFAYPCASQCALIIETEDGQSRVELPLQGPFDYFDKDGIRGQLKLSGVLSDVFVERDLSVWQKKVNGLTEIHKFYKNMLPILFPVAIVLLTFMAAAAVCRKENLALTVIGFALIGAILTRIVLISLIDVTSFPAVNTLYLAPAYPILIGFVFIVLYWGGQQVCRIITRVRL